MKYQVIITTADWVKRISFKNEIRAKCEYIWWERMAKERGFTLISVKAINKETGEVLFEKEYAETV